jgi:hypothetical protein
VLPVKSRILRSMFRSAVAASCEADSSSGFQELQHLNLTFDCSENRLWLVRLHGIENKPRKICKKPLALGTSSQRKLN